MSQVEIDLCPILTPTIKEFKNFFEYVEKIDKLYSKKYGMVKPKIARNIFLVLFLIQVIPPTEWRARKKNYHQALQNLNVNGPIEQNIFGKAGIYECLLIQKKSLSLNQYKIKTGVFDKIAQGLSSQEVQQLFWKNVVYSPPLYGADLLNTLMDEQAGSWNLNNLDSVLSHSMETKVKGVNTPYCYIGSWKTLFCWHKQDLDLAAINFLHEGKSKFWYSIPQNQASILQKQAKKHFPEHFSKCHQFLRHKTTLINPYLLKRTYPELKISKMEHKPNQFMLIFGGAYHSGFNFGCNIAQAVNYATTDWLKHLKEAKSCTCSKNNVNASLFEIYRNLVKSPLNQHPSFLQFQSRIFKQVQNQKSEDNSKEQRALKSKFSKKIKKNQKITALTYKGEQYQIDQWAQCEKCQIWRKIKKALKKNEHFQCKNTKKTCHKKQKILKNYIILNSQ